MAKTVNRASMSVSGTPGTSTITLDAAWPRFDDFEGAGVASGDLVSYLFEDDDMWEYGFGTYLNTAGTLTLARTTILRSSAGTATAINSTNTGGSSARVSVATIEADQGPDFMSTHNQTVNYSYTLRDGYNGHSVGPITIGSGFAVTIPSGSTWVIV